MPISLNVTLQDSSVIEIAQARLRNAKVRVTTARLDVLTTLLVKQRALSHTELQDALPTMDRVTLYRALDCLAEAGLAHKITGEDRVFRFSTGNDQKNMPAQHGVAEVAQKNLKQHQHQHGHFTCTQCGQVHCLDHSDVTLTLKDQLHATLAATRLQGFESHDIEVTIKGWCKQCVQLKNSDEST